MELGRLLQTNPRKFWQSINPDSSNSVINLRDTSGDLVSETEAANALNDFFSSVFTIEDTANIPQLSFLAHEHMLPVTITSQGIQSVINKLKLSSACGDDGINSKVLKNTAAISSLFLCDIFNQSLNTATVPKGWKSARVTPIFKGGDRHNPSNYRPISLTSVPGKIMEHIVYSSIINFLETNSILTTAQHGFRKGFSCETQLLQFTHDIHVNLDSRKATDAIFIDFSKAFDKVPHARLLYKLSRLNVDKTILEWVRSFLCSRQQHTFANAVLSTTTHVTSVVPQGSVLGPLLF